MLRIDQLSMQRQFLLAIAVKAVDNTLGLESLVPSVLVYGEFLTIRAHLGLVILQNSLAESAVVAQEAQKSWRSTLHTRN